MGFKKYFVIFALFIVLLVSFNAINAVSADSIDNITSEMDSDYSILQNEDAAVDTLEINNESNVGLSSKDDLKQQNQSSAVTAKDTSSKSNLKVTTFSNFVKKGNYFNMHLADEKGNAVPNKKVNVNFNGKTYVKTTNKNGNFGIKVDLSKSSATIKVNFKGDKKYNPFSKKIKFNINKSFSITIGNSKLLTNGYLRVYLKGPKKLISHKNIKIIIGKKNFTKITAYEGVVVLKPKVSPGIYNIHVKYKNYRFSRTVKCIEGNVSDPLEKSIPTKNGVPDIDSMPKNYILGDNSAKYTLDKSQYLEAIKRDSYSLYLFGKLPKYTFFKVKSSPNMYHIMKREKWNVIERAVNTAVVKKNKYKYWPKSITVSLNGKSYTYSEVRDIQNTGVTCGSASASVCSQALRNFHSEKFFQIETNTIYGVNIPVLKKAIDENNFKTYYFNGKTINNAVKQV